MKPKSKACKRCSKEFQPWSSLDKYCSVRCSTASKNEKEKEKKKTDRMKKAVSVSALSKKADTLFSEYVRKRDFERYGWKCVTCGETFDYAQLQCGHFISRARKSVRWNKKNASAQCAGCNCWGGGRQYEHGLELDRRWWAGTADEILRTSNSDFKLTSDYLQDVIAFYKGSLEEMKKV